MKFWKKILAQVKYDRAVKMANKAYEETGHMHFVIPNRNGKIVLVVMDRKNFRSIRDKGYIDKNARMLHLYATCVYHTPNAKGENGMTADAISWRKRKFISWYINTH